MKNKINVITIDGPSASGKGSLSKKIAKKNSFKLLDSGVLYRLFAHFSILDFSTSQISEKIKNEIKYKLIDELAILYNDIDITLNLRSEKIAKTASNLSSKKYVREALLEIQRDFYDENGLVADGRDMGTVVFKNAKLKIFLTALPEVRAKRRYLELQNLGQDVNMPALMADIEQRDFRDRSRALSPLLPADDAHIIDSSNMSHDEVLQVVENLIKKEFK